MMKKNVQWALVNPGSIGALLIVAGLWMPAWAQQNGEETPQEGSPIEGLLQERAVTPPQREFARVIEIVCPQGIASPELQRDCDAVVGNALAEADPEVTATVGQLTADQASVPTSASQNSVVMQARNVGDRLAALRAGAMGISIRELTFDFNGQTISAEQLARQYRNQESGGAAGADVGIFDLGRLGIFINGNIGFGDKDATPNVAGFDFDTYGITAGVDYRFIENFILGGAFGYVITDVDLDQDDGKLETDGYSFTLYSTYYWDRLYVDGSVTYGRNDYDQERNIRYTLPGPEANVDQTLLAEFDGDQWNLNVGTGYEFSHGPWTFGPLGRLEYIRSSVDGYRERAARPEEDGSGWTVEVDRQKFESFTLNLGAQGSYALSLPWGVLVPQTRAAWVHEFKENGRLITGRFVGDPSREEFRLPTDQTDENYFNLGVGASAVFPRGISAFVFYQTILGFSDLNFHNVTGGVRWEF